MKKLRFALVSLILTFIVTSWTFQSQDSPRTFDKIVWLEVNFENDSVLFKPYSKAWQELWHILDSDIFVEGSSIMNYTNYKHSFNNRKDNLYTILHPNIIDGSVHLFSPYDPKSYGLGTQDDGEMRYPLRSENDNQTYLTSELLRETYAYYLGRFGPQADYPLVDEFGEPMIELDTTTGNYDYLYPPRDYMWYEDVDIIKYKIRVRISYNKKGIEKKRTIESIAPVVYEIYDGQIKGERELFWLDFKEIVEILKDGFYFDSNGKPVSYLNHLQLKVLKASF